MAIRMTEDGWYTIPEVAHLVHAHPQTVRRLVKQGKIRYGIFGKRKKINKDDLETYLRTQDQGETNGENRHQPTQ